jgi:hypothetical protein
MKSITKYFLAILILTVFSTQGYSQDLFEKAPSDEKLIEYLYIVYFYEGFNNGMFDSCLLEKTESLCYRVLEKDSSNFHGNYYLSLIYYNEMARTDTNNDPGSARRDSLEKKFLFYSDKAKSLMDIRQKTLQEASEDDD